MSLFGLRPEEPAAIRIREAATRGTLSHALLLTGSGARMSAASFAATSNICATTALFSGVIATILGAIGMIDWLVPFLNILCVVVPPITGAMLADFYILKNADNYRFELMDKIPNVRPDTSIGAIVGCLVGLCMNEPPVGFGVPFMVRLSTIVPSALVAMACSVVMVLIANQFTAKKAA